MYRFLFAFRETLIAALVIIPLFLVISRRNGLSPQRRSLYLLFSLYLCAVYAVVGLPNITYIRFEPNINLKPFQYMFSDLETTILNVILFIPLGVFLPILWARFQKFRLVLLAGISMSLFIELAQILTFRATDINDLMTNTAGTVVGFFIAQFLIPRFSCCNSELNTIQMRTVFVLPLCVMFLAHPFLSEFIYSLL